MSPEALGGYMRQLRRSQRLSATQVAQAAGLNVTYIWRIEYGKIKRPGAFFVGTLLHLLNANADTALRLLCNPNASAADGAACAAAELARPTLDSISGGRELAASTANMPLGHNTQRVPNHMHEEVQALLDLLLEHPYELGKVIEYGRQLLRLNGMPQQPKHDSLPGSQQSECEGAADSVNRTCAVAHGSGKEKL